MIEPILGSGGCIAPPDAFWPALAELCEEHGWLLCADEVKTGFGRSGRMFAARALGRRAGPDLPRQGDGRRRDADRRRARDRSARWAASTTCSTGSTWSWLPGSCAAALATLDAFEREDVLANVARARARPAPSGSGRDRASASRPVGDVRAVGCFLAIEFVRDRADQGARPRAPGRGRGGDAAPRRDRRLEHDLAQPAAVAVMPPGRLEAALAIVAECDRRPSRRRR